MKKNSLKWAAAFSCITFVFLFPASHHLLIKLTETHPYCMGFIKFATLAFLGQLMGIRITYGDWIRPKGLFLRILFWGLLGMAIVFVLPLAYQGVTVLQQQGLFFNADSLAIDGFIKAFAASIIFNLLPGPIVIIYHSLAESFVELCDGKMMNLKHVRFSSAIMNIDWVNLIQFVIFKVNLILFIPINTIIFLLPPDQRVLLAAYSSILLGVVLGYYNARKKSPTHTA